MIDTTKHISVMVMVLTFLLSASNASAHNGAKGVVKQRMDAMTEMAKAMKTMAQMVKGKRAFDPALFIDKSEIISGHSSRVPELFPKGSIKGTSEALPVIWKQWDDFVNISEQTKKSAKELVKMAQEGSALRPLTKQFVKLSGGCKACHKSYRKKK